MDFKENSQNDELTKIGISIVVGVVLEVLFKGQNIPFWQKYQ